MDLQQRLEEEAKLVRRWARAAGNLEPVSLS